MADQENKDFSEDIADQTFEQQNGDATANNGSSGNGTVEPTENGQESQEER